MFCCSGKRQYVEKVFVSLYVLPVRSSGQKFLLRLEFYHSTWWFILTLLIVPLPLHLLDDAEVEHGVPALAPAVQGRQEVGHDALVPRLAGAGQARQVLQDQLLPVLGETLRIYCSIDVTWNAFNSVNSSNNNRQLTFVCGRKIIEKWNLNLQLLIKMMVRTI